MAKEIDINGKKLALELNGEGLYWAGKEEIDFDSHVRSLSEPANDSATSVQGCRKFTATVELLWVALSPDSRSQYKTPATLAALFIPMPPPEKFNEIGEAIVDIFKGLKQEK